MCVVKDYAWSYNNDCYWQNKFVKKAFFQLADVDNKITLG